MTTTSTSLSEPAAVGAQAAEILAAVQGSDVYDRLVGSAKRYVDCWATRSGSRLPSTGTYPPRHRS